MLHRLQRVAAVVAAYGALGVSSANGAPLTLDQARATALRQNTDVQIARLQQELANTEAVASWSRVLPTIDVAAGAGSSYDAPQQRVATTPVTVVDPITGQPTQGFQRQTVYTPANAVNNFALGAHLQQTLFDGLSGPRSIARARLGQSIASRRVEEVAATITFEVTRRFYDVVRADRILMVLAQTVERSEEVVKQSTALNAAGRVPEFEVVTATVNLGADRLNFENYRARAAQARADLAVVLGVSADTMGDPVPPADVDQRELASHPPPSFERLLARAKQLRPAFWRMRAQSEQAALDRKIAAGEWFPKITGSLSYDRGGPTFGGSDGVWGDPMRQYVATAQVTAVWNVFNGFQTYADQERAAINERVTDALKEQLAVQVNADIVRTRENLLSLTFAFDIAAKNLVLAEEGAHLAADRLVAGLGTLFDVREANLKLTLARVNLVGVRLDILIAQADLQRAVGGPY